MIVDARLRTIVAIVSALVLSWAAVGGTGSADAAALTVRITDGLDPTSVTVPSSTTVTFLNADGERHRVRTTAGPTEFDSGNLDPGQSFTVALRSTGVYRYRDERNTDNAAYFGSITVSDSVSTTTVDPSAPPPTTVGAPTAVSVSIGDRVFVPSSVTVAPGGTVTWTNNDDRPHTVTANDRSFDSGIMETGATWSRTFPNGGTFAYFCELHPDMTGSVTVAASGGGGGTPPPPPTTSSPPTSSPPATTQPPVTTVPSGGGPGAPASASIAISGNRFSPQVVTIVAGGTVTWTNQDAVPHTATSTTGLFASGFLRQGDQYSQTFAAVGTYAYFCELHPEMTATVVVIAPDAPATPATQPPATTASAKIAPPITTTAPTSNQPVTTVPSVGGSPLPSTGSVTIAGNQFSPRTITIAVGGTVSWVNQDAVPHTVTASDRSFDSGIMMQGDRWSRTFTAAGTYTYFCEIHPSMTATVIVTTPDAAQPPVVTAGGSTTGGTAGGASGGVTSTGTGAAVQQAVANTSGAAVSASSSVPGSASVGMGDNQFLPATVTIGTEGSVTWTNTDTIPHTVTADDGAFDSGILMPGDTFTRTFSSAGAVGYRCTLHTGMAGTVQVLAEVAGSGGGSGTASSDGSTEATSGATTGNHVDGTAELSESVVVSIENGAVPDEVTVAVGQSVTWVNNDDVAHNVIAIDGSFRSEKFMGPGREFEHVFLEPGTYPYRCDIHDDMHGVVTVVAADATPDAESPTVTVTVTDTGFDPVDMVVHPGDTVVWQFTGVLPHTVTADDGSFDSGILQPGDTFTFTFDTLGTFRYTCLLHPSMIGSITVAPPDEEVAGAVSGVEAFGGRSNAPVAEGAPNGEGGGSSSVPMLVMGLLAGVAISLVIAFGAAIARQSSRSAAAAA